MAFVLAPAVVEGILWVGGIAVGLAATAGVGSFVKEALKLEN